MVESFIRDLNAYVCILALDGGWRSGRIRRIVAKRYIDIDAATGRRLVLLTTVPPPDDWFNAKAAELAKLPMWARYVARAHMIGAKKNTTLADANSARLFSQYLEGAPKPPALYFFRPVPVTATTSELRALAFTFSGFVFEGRLMSAFAYLGKLAEEIHNSGGDAFELARRGFAWGSVRSLAWQNTAFATVSAFTLVAEWLQEMKKSLVGGGA